MADGLGRAGGDPSIAGVNTPHNVPQGILDRRLGIAETCRGERQADMREERDRIPASHEVRIAPGARQTKGVALSFCLEDIEPFSDEAEAPRELLFAAIDGELKTVSARNASGAAATRRKATAPSLCEICIIGS